MFHIALFFLICLVLIVGLAMGWTCSRLYYSMKKAKAAAEKIEEETLGSW